MYSFKDDILKIDLWILSLEWAWSLVWYPAYYRWTDGWEESTPSLNLNLFRVTTIGPMHLLIWRAGWFGKKKSVWNFTAGFKPTFTVYRVPKTFFFSPKRPTLPQLLLITLDLWSLHLIYVYPVSFSDVAISGLRLSFLSKDFLFW